MTIQTPEGRAALQRAWKKANPEKTRASNAKWRDANRERVAGYHAAYCARNPEKRWAKDARYRAANREKRRASFAAWYARNRKRPKVADVSPDGRPIVSLADARAAGLKRYFTGLPCRSGHISERRTSGSVCLACHAEAGVRFRASPAFDEERRERARQRVAQWRQSPDGQAWTSRYSAECWAKKKSDMAFRERSRASVRAWARAHRDRKRAMDAAWRQANKSQPEFKQKQRIRVLNRIARKRAAAGKYSIADIRAIYLRQAGACACGCGGSLADGKFHTDHILPLSRGGSNWPRNIQLLTPSCNMSKGDSTMEEWAARRPLNAVVA